MLSFFAFTSYSISSLAEDHMEIAWETEKVFELPESVIYDSNNDVLYVSNITDHPFNKDGTGYISKLSLDGSIIEKNGLII